MAKRRGLAVDGVLLLDKPVGLSSNHALQRARGVLKARKAGHTGTLDPFATGLLVLCFGEATKWSGRLFEADKSYEASLVWGSETDTGDLTGHVITTLTDAELAQRRPTAEQIQAALQTFLGEQWQTPPMYSALKRDGKPLYEYARKGEEVEREPRRIVIHGLELLAHDPQGCRILLHCSKGTYVRVLAQDLGRKLGCLAHLGALRRTRTAGFDVANAVSLEALEARRDQALAPIEALLWDRPVVTLPARAARSFLHGQRQEVDHPACEQVRVHDHNHEFLGTARCDGRWLIPDRILNFEASE